VIPTVYEIIDEWRERAMGWVKRRRTSKRAPSPEEVEDDARELVPAGVGRD
jgi:hypothetical protein